MTLEITAENSILGVRTQLILIQNIILCYFFIGEIQYSAFPIQACSQNLKDGSGNFANACITMPLYKIDELYRNGATED
jgi:hypothetical protein